MKQEPQSVRAAQAESSKDAKVPTPQGPRVNCQKFHPESRMLVAYIPCSPFAVELCETCGEVVTYWGRWKSLVWNLLVRWWWNGEMIVNENGHFPESWRDKLPTKP
jgi:hypothetical protein